MRAIADSVNSVRSTFLPLPSTTLTLVKNPTYFNAKNVKIAAIDYVNVTAQALTTASFNGATNLGLAVLASLAASRTHDLLAAGQGHLAALTGGYHLGFWVCAALVLSGGVPR